MQTNNHSSVVDRQVSSLATQKVRELTFLVVDRTQRDRIKVRLGRESGSRCI